MNDSTTDTPANDTKFKPNPPAAPRSALSEMEAVELELKRLQVARLMRDEQAYADQEEATRLSRLGGIDSVRLKMAGEKQRQDHCAHLKENGRTHLAGQKDHSGTIIAICQGCQKLFRGGEIPAHLFPTADGAIGGPH